jgi:hypothetical protein
MAAVEEDDWEYEYDEKETEDFYITVDLSHALAKPVTNHPLHSSASRNPTRVQTRLRAINTSRKYAENVLDLTNSDSSPATRKMQIAGLHTTNPLIMYEDQLLSCKWASTIGTDMFFVTPDLPRDSQNQSGNYSQNQAQEQARGQSQEQPRDQAQNQLRIESVFQSRQGQLQDVHQEHHQGANQAPPLRSLPTVDLLCVSSTKLMARAARLRPRDELFDIDQAADTMEVTTGVTPSLTTEGASSGASNTSNSFLTKLNEAKAKRGEKSRLMASKNADGSRLVLAVAECHPTEDTAMESIDDQLLGVGTDLQTS